MNTSAYVGTALIGVVTYWVYHNFFAPVKPPKMMGQSKFVTKPVPGETGIFRHAKSADALVTDLAGMKTLDELMKYAKEKWGPLDCIGTKTHDAHGKSTYVFKTYNEIIDGGYAFSSGFANMGVKPGDHVGIYAPSSVEWKQFEIGCYVNSVVIVSLYDTLAPDAVSYILQHAEIGKTVSARKYLPKLLQAVEKNYKECKENGSKFYLTDLILTSSKASLAEDEEFKKLAQQFENMGIKIFYFPDIIEDGKKNPAKLTSPKPDDLATMMYTSGTTGHPKGVMITHLNFLSCLGGFSTAGKNYVPPAPTSSENQQRELSYLPLAHVMQRLSECGSFFFGKKLAYFQGDIKNLKDDFQIVKPATILGVPRIYQRIYDTVWQTINESPPVRRFLFKAAFNYKRRAISRGQRTPLLDKIIFSKVQAAAFGGAVRTMTSGSAPLSPEVHEFLRVCFSYEVGEAYGLTETTAGCTVQDPLDPQCGRVGPPNPAIEIKLVDVPDMKYLSTDPLPRGEIVVRGAPVTKGYYKEPEKTAEVFKENGWFFTGDIGRLNDDGTVSIIDRKKNIFKLSQGEYIAPEFIENILLRSRFVQQCCVFGDSTKSYLVGIIVPDREFLNLKFPTKPKDLETLCKDEELRKIILHDLHRVSKEAKLNGMEFVKNIFLESNLFTTENDMLTHTMKLKRNFVYHKYLDVFHKLYEETDKQQN